MEVIPVLLVVHLIIAAVFLLLGIALINGKGTFLIAGYNTASKERKEKIDDKKLSRFTGKLLLASAGCWIVIAFGDVFQSVMLNLIGFGVFIIIVAAGVVYANTGKRFIRSE